MTPTQPTIDWSGFLPYIKIGGGVLIPTYFLITSLAFIICILWMVRRAERFEFSRVMTIDTALVLMITGFVGSRIFHVAFEEPRYYLENPIRVFQFWRGGFVWYGGAIVGSISALAFLFERKQPLLEWLDFFAPIGALGYALGRMACLFTGCCYGQIFTLPEFFGHQTMRHPTQLYAVFTELISLAIVLHFEKKKNSPNPPPWLKRSGRIFFLWLILHSIGRILMEAFRGDPRGPDLLTLSVSTWISFLLIVFAILAIHRTALAGPK
jgi:phosphatidylglycerol:prolipoprotein diacylglycerol transferase